MKHTERCQYVHCQKAWTYRLDFTHENIKHGPFFYCDEHFNVVFDSINRDTPCNTNTTHISEDSPNRNLVRSPDW